jgi:hypothetical protein
MTENQPSKQTNAFSGMQISPTNAAGGNNKDLFNSIREKFATDEEPDDVYSTCSRSEICFATSKFDVSEDDLTLNECDGDKSPPQGQ